MRKLRPTKMKQGAGGRVVSTWWILNFWICVCWWSTLLAHTKSIWFNPILRVKQIISFFLTFSGFHYLNLHCLLLEWFALATRLCPWQTRDPWLQPPLPRTILKLKHIHNSQNVTLGSLEPWTNTSSSSWLCVAQVPWFSSFLLILQGLLAAYFKPNCNLPDNGNLDFWSHLPREFCSALSSDFVQLFLFSSSFPLLAIVQSRLHMRLKPWSLL